MDPSKTNPVNPQVGKAVAEAIKSLPKEEKQLWNGPLTKLAWLTHERQVNSDIAPEGLAAAVLLSTRLSPAQVPTQWLESWCLLRKNHPGVPRVKLDGNQKNYIEDFKQLNLFQLTAREKLYLQDLESQYIGVDKGVKPEFVVREFGKKEDADEYLKAVGDTVLQENWTLPVNTAKGTKYYAVSYDKEDTPSFVALKVLELSGVEFTEKDRAKINEVYTSWEAENPSENYWTKCMKYARYCSIQNTGTVDSSAVHRVWEMTARRDDPDLSR
jgi:hypothetical protein